MQMLDHRGAGMKQRWTERDSRSLADAALHDQFVNTETSPRFSLRGVEATRSRHILRDCERFPSGSEDFVELQWRLAAAGLGQSIGVGVSLSEDRSFVLVLHRSREDSRGFDDADEAFLRDLAPHLEQVAQLSESIDRAKLEHAALGNTLHQLRTGVVLCDGQRRIHWMNRAAETILKESTEISAAHDRLCCADRDDALSLSRLIARFADGGEQGCAPIVIGRHSDFPVQLMALSAEMLPSTRRSGADDAGLIAVILGRPGDVVPMSVPDVAELFGLTGAEARLTIALCEGISVADYAIGRGISLGTARVQLKNALAKTQTHRQAELVRQVCASVMTKAIRV
ncbi:MAG: helix-turn-helix transcriptional regulator [Sphingomonas sp.]